MQVSLLTESGDTKDDLRLPTDDQLLTQVSASLLSLTYLCLKFDHVYLDVSG